MNNINQHIVDQLSAPRSAIISNITVELNQIQNDLGGDAKGLVHNICRRLLKDSGECITLTKQQVFDSWKHTGVPQAELESAIQALIKRNFLTSENGFIRIKSNSLGKYIHAAIEADIAALGKVETMVAREFRSYKITKRYLSPQAISQVSPVLSRLILPNKTHQFVLDSIAFRRRRRLWNVLIISCIIAALSGLSIIALVQSSRAKQSAQIAKSETNVAIQKQAEANQLAAKLKLQSDTITAQNKDLDSLILIANEKALLAENERGIAVSERKKTEVQLGLTEEANREAEAQKRAAEDAAEDARQHGDAAKKEAVRANLEQGRAEEALIKAERLRNELLTVALAEKSLSAPEGAQSDTIRAMVARVAYNLEAHNHSQHADHPVQPKVYMSLYYAHKLLTRPKSYMAPVFQPSSVHAMTYNPRDKKLYLSVGDGHLQSASFDRSMSDAASSFPAVEPIPSKIRQPARHIIVDNSQSIIASSGEFIFHLDILHDKETQYAYANGVKIINVIPMNRDDEYLVLTSTNNLYIFNLTSGSFKPFKGITKVTHVAFIKRLNILIYTTKEDRIVLFNLNNNTSTEWESRSALSKLMVKDYGDKIFIVFGYMNGAVRVGITDDEELLSHDGATSPVQQTIRMLETILSSNVHAGFITDIDFASTTHKMVVASGDGSASFWDLDSWSQRQTDYQPLLLDDHDGWVTSCSINSDLNIILTGSTSGEIRIWPMDPSYFANKICDALGGRSLNKREWGIYIGNEVNFENRICE